MGYRLAYMKLRCSRAVFLFLSVLYHLVFLQVYALPVDIELTSIFPNLSLYARSNESSKSTHASSEPSKWAFLGTSVLLVLLGGAFAGLTIAMMGQDEIYLKVMASSGEGRKKVQAKKVLSLLERGKHWVLVTLLLSNVITNETLPIVLDRSLGGGWPAVLASTILIVIFGEIVPQSVCVRFGLPIGAWMSPFVLGLMWIMSPIAWPTAKLLDFILGTGHATPYKKAGLKTLVMLHRTLGTCPDERLSKDEVTIISAVLDLKEKPVGSIMTPIDDVFTLSANAVLDERMMNKILTAGYSRIPIYSPENRYNFVGMLLVKMLITYDPQDCLRVCDFSLATLPETRPETSCLDIVNFFQEGKSHMALVSEYPGESHGALGVVTLEDVIEELIGEEIIDESDVFIDVHKAIRRLHPAPCMRIPKFTQPSTENYVNGTNYNNRGLWECRSVGCIGQTSSGDTDEALISPDSSIEPFLPQTLYIKRRNSDNTDSLKVQAIPINGDASKIREAFKHLGPSNVASHPKQTKINSVTIKPGIVPFFDGRADKGQIQKPSRSQSYGIEEIRSGTKKTPGIMRTISDYCNPLTSSQTARGHDGYGTMKKSSSFRSIHLSEPRCIKSNNNLKYSSIHGNQRQSDESTSGGVIECHDSSDLSESEVSMNTRKLVIPSARPPSLGGESMGSCNRPGDVRGTCNDGKMRCTSFGSLNDSDTSNGEEDKSLKKEMIAKSGHLTESFVDSGGVMKLVIDLQPDQIDESFLDEPGTEVYITEKKPPQENGSTLNTGSNDIRMPEGETSERSGKKKKESMRIDNESDKDFSCTWNDGLGCFSMKEAKEDDEALGNGERTTRWGSLRTKDSSRSTTGSVLKKKRKRIKGMTK